MDNPLPVSVDFLSFTLSGVLPGDAIHEAMSFLGVRQSTRRPGGISGYESSVDLDGYGFVGFGGDSQRGTVLVSINGAGCRRVADFRRVGEWAQRYQARVTRLDIAADDLDGQVFDLKAAVRAWRSGAFQCSGRPPLSTFIDDMGSGKGCTFNVGSRKSGKLFRMYEKGKQLGDVVSRWVRAEVEFLAKDRVIPWAAVFDPITFLAGAYPFFAKLSLVASTIATAKRGAQITIEAVRRWVREAAGPALHVLLHVFGGDYGELVNQVRREGVPRRLKGWVSDAGAPCFG